MSDDKITHPNTKIYGKCDFTNQDRLDQVEYERMKRKGFSDEDLKVVSKRDKHGWIKIESDCEMPRDSVPVRLCFADGLMCNGWHFDNRDEWQVEGAQYASDVIPTHWQPLPERPEELMNS